MGDQGAAKKRDQAGPSPEPPPPTTEDPRDLAGQVIVALAPIQIYGAIATADAQGEVILDGAVRTEQDFIEAEQLAQKVPGVTRVINRLVVQTLTGSMPMQRTVLSPEIAAEMELNHLIVERSVGENFTREIGTTDTAEATDEAEPYFPPTDPPTMRAPRDAQGFQVVGGFSQTSLDAPIGLEQVPDRLLGGDDEIARLIHLALREDASTTDLPIAVVVRAGVVRLHGVVQSLADAEQAEAIASQVPGVVEVIEDLDIAGL